MIKVVAINGSPRKKGNTWYLLKKVLEQLESEGIQTEIIHLGGNKISGCEACYACKDRKDNTCKLTNDQFNEVFAKCVAADGILLGSPVYVGGMTSQLKAFIDRACLVNKYNNEPLRRKAGAAVVAVRRNGALETFNSINNFFTISQMLVVGASYWNQGIGRNKGEVLEDIEGMNTMVNLGQNMAWVLKQLNIISTKTETLEEVKRIARKKNLKNKDPIIPTAQGRS